MKALHWILPLVVTPTLVYGVAQPDVSRWKEDFFNDEALAGETVGAAYPPPAQLPERRELPAALTLFDGTPVRSRAGWFAKRRPELLDLFRHYMYGVAPPSPAKVNAKVERTDADYFGGKATKREVTLRVGPEGAPVINLLLLTPNGGRAPAPALVALNWAGNYAVVNDPTIPVTGSWMYDRRPGVTGNRAGEAARGWEKDYWCAEYLIERGYALATFYNGDISPEGAMLERGIQRHFFAPGQTERGAHEWGCISAWAWGMSRVVDYLLTVPETVDPKRIVAFGHSRHGKTALWAAAQDERFAVALPHQSGVGGASLNRNESLTTAFTFQRVVGEYPHWFAPVFQEFREMPAKLPFDQHLLVAAVAPRPVLFTDGDEDACATAPLSWQTMQAADPLYKFLGLRGLAAGCQTVGEEATNGPKFGELMYYLRPKTEHVLDRAYWGKLLDFTDRCFAERKTAE